MAFKTYRLTKQEEKARESVYDSVQKMIDERQRKWPHFNCEYGDRTLTEYINDSDRRLNAYSLPRETAGKEDWQSNLFNPQTRNKLKALVAGVALNVPELHYRAVNKNGTFSSQRAEMMKQLVRHSRLQGNPQLDIFFEAWECAGKGTVVKFDGYLKTKYKRKYIKSYDLETGDIETDSREENVDDRPIDILVPLTEFYIRDFHIFDVQDQPDVAWIQKYNKEQLEQEFGKYKNFKHVKDAGTVKRFESTEQSYFYEKWAGRLKDKDEYEVIRYFNKLEDRYEIWVNGVPLLRAPLLWGKCDKKYPFSKTILEPFTGYNFFYGKSLPSILEGIQDMDNELLNTMLDKLKRSLTPPMLVGLANKDLFDVESELINQDNKIYVPDVNQVKPMPYDGINQGEIAMLEVVSRMGDLATVDSNQQGIQGQGVTAREVIIADERARQLKGVFFMFLEDLWLQKTRLRILNILMNYTQPRTEKILGKGGAEQIRNALTMFHIPDVEFSDGSVGILGVHIAQDENGLMSLPEIEAREEVAQKNGVNYKLVSTTSTYLDDWDYDFELVTSSIANQDKVRKGAEFQEKMQTLATIFPEYVANNKDKLFKEAVEVYGESVDDYKQPAPPQPAVLPDGTPLAEGEQLLTAGNANPNGAVN